MYQEFNGVRFYLSKSSGYYERARGVPRKMHVYVWEFYNGKVPSGYCIHHVDRDKGHNTIDNLELMTVVDHAKLHNDGQFKGQELAKEWHKSEKGYLHHVENGVATSSKWPERKYICEVCGATFARKSPRTDYRFCSNICKSKWRRKSGIDNEVRKCAYCGKEFEVNKYAKTLCCSRGCSASLRWHKKNT